MSKYRFYFAVGSQHLYGNEVLKEVEKHSKEIVETFNESNQLSWPVTYKGVLTSSKDIETFIRESNYHQECAGVIVWMHTFSPSKMWIKGLSQLNKPYLHINTQFNKKIPFDKIDMNFMNTNQSAHGDREHGFITARMNIKRKVITGFWKDIEMQKRIGSWMRSAVGVSFSRQLKVLRLGDNMREVAVTEGDKVEAEIKLGWSVNTFAVGILSKLVDSVSETELNSKVNEYMSKYEIITKNMKSIEYQARLEVAIEKMLEDGSFNAFTNTFEDLHGLKQLPGLATQNLMSKGYGFGAEGDWKTSALCAIVYEMSKDLGHACSFIEDYTYHMEKGNEFVLGAHMLEISPNISIDNAKIEVFPLGIGGKEDPARLLFKGKVGDALLVTMIDMGNRFRIITHDVKGIDVDNEMPNLPVAYTAWKPTPDFITGNEAWILAGGTHHSVITYDLDAEVIRQFAEMMDIEFIHINAETNISDFKKNLSISDMIWRNK